MNMALWFFEKVSKNKGGGMKINSFKITNFRSIVDSGWVPFSPDGITVFVGQNESGKTSVLDALYLAISGDRPTEDDLRIGAPLPVVRLRIETDFAELTETLDHDHYPEEMEALKSFLDTEKQVDLCLTWQLGQTKEGAPIYIALRYLDSDVLLRQLDLAAALVEHNESIIEAFTEEIEKAVVPVGTALVPASSTASIKPELRNLNLEDVGEAAWACFPLAVLFNEETGHLPSQVDINEKGVPAGVGARAAQNFLSIAGIKLEDLIKLDRRARENILNRANAKVSEDFNSFWSQTIGKSGRLSLKCDIDRYSDKTPDKAGKEHLVFWICDGNTQLYPKQRSQGVRWFVSFYLQLKASEKRGEHKIFLLDEPGSNLHAKAQADVLKLINKLPKTAASVIYSTHSPHMLEYPKLFRVHAVQRNGEQDDSPTVIIDAHSLGSASSDTLSPVLTAMGVDLSHHQVIKKTNNVLLEEMSGYYYLTAFWKLSGQKKEVHFIAATGVNKVEALANMFRGWGLDFIVAVDDDKQGREAFKSMKRELFGDDDELAKLKLLKLPDCPGIEDAFGADDFKKYVLKEDVAIPGSNSEFLKTAGRSKPVLAFQFALAVESGEIKWTDFGDVSKQKITAIVDALAGRLG